MTDTSPGEPRPQQPVPAAYTQPSQSTPDTSVFAILSLIGAFIFAGIPGIIFGHLALRSIRTTKESGRGLALAGTIIGYVNLGLTILAGLVIIIVLFALAASHESYYVQTS